MELQAHLATLTPNLRNEDCCLAQQTSRYPDTTAPIHRVFSRLLQDMALLEIACFTPLVSHQDMEEVLHSRLEMTANSGKQEDVGCLPPSSNKGPNVGMHGTA